MFKKTELTVTTRQRIPLFSQEAPAEQARVPSPPMIRKLILLCLLLTKAVEAPAQIQLPDSVRALLNGKPDTAQINILNTYAFSVYLKEFDKARTIVDSVLPWAERVKYVKGEATALQIDGLILYYKGAYEKSTESFVKSIRLHEQIGDKSGEAKLCNDLANLLRKHDDVPGATNYLKRAMDIYLALGDKDGLANTWNNTGVVHEYVGQLDSAMACYQRALTLYSEINSLTGMGYSYDYIGLIHAYKEEFELSLAAMQKAFEIREKLGEKQAMGTSLVNMGEVNLAMGKYKEALALFNRSQAIGKEMGFPDLVSYNYKVMSEAYAGMGDYKSAFEQHKLFSTYSDSLFNLKRNEQVAEIQSKYETEKKEKENLQLQSKNAEQALMLSKQRLYLIALITVVIAVVLGTSLYTSRNKLKQERLLNEEIQRQESLRLRAVIESQEQERRRIAAELHDGLGQVLSAARVNLASAKGESEIKNSLELIDRSCSDLREISHNMMPAALGKGGIVPAIEEMIGRINAAGTTHFDLDVDGMDQRLPKETEVHLFRIAQELINNILKYAEAKEASVQLVRENNGITMMVEDNGKGFEKKQLEQGTGNGWYNILSRLKLINGEIEVDARPGSGAVFTIHLNQSAS